MTKTSRLISVYTGLYKLLQFRFHPYLGPLLDDVSLEKSDSLNIWVNHETRVSFRRVCLVPVDAAQPSCFPDGPWRLEGFWKQSLRANVPHLWATVTNTGSSSVSELVQCPRCYSNLLSAALVAASCCSPGLSVASWPFHPLPRSDPGPQLPRLSKYLRPASPCFSNMYLLWLIEWDWVSSRPNVITGVTKKNVCSCHQSGTKHTHTFPSFVKHPHKKKSLSNKCRVEKTKKVILFSSFPAHRLH